MGSGSSCWGVTVTVRECSVAPGVERLTFCSSVAVDILIDFQVLIWSALGVAKSVTKGQF